MSRRAQLRRTAVGVGLAVLATGLPSCADDAVRVIGDCEPAGDSSRIVAFPESPWTLTAPSFGIVGDNALVSWGEWDVTSGWAPERAYRYSSWLRPDMTPDDSIPHGREPLVVHRPRWVAAGGRLNAQIWSVPSETSGPVREEDGVALWSLDPGDREPNRALIHIPVVRDSLCSYCAVVTLGASTNPGLQGLYPATHAYGAFWGALTARTYSCGGRFGLVLVRTTDSQAHPVLWPGACDEGAPDVSSPWLFSLEDGSLAALFLYSDNAVHYIMIGSDGSPAGRPKRVAPSQSVQGDGGFQPRAVAVPGGRVLFTYRHGVNNECHGLRVMDANGDSAEDAPWQLPCMSDHAVISASVELQAIEGGAVLLWTERTRLRGSELRVTTGVDYAEAVRAVILTPEGQRGSAVATLTDSNASTLRFVPRTDTTGPTPGEFLPGVANEGENFVVGWLDERLVDTGPGIYARRARCRVSP